MPQVYRALSKSQITSVSSHMTGKLSESHGGFFHFIRGLAPSMNFTEYHHVPDDWPYLNHVEGTFILSEDLDPLWIAQSIIFPDDWPYLNHTDSIFILSEDWDPLYESHRVTSSSHMTGTLSESQIFIISAEECGLLWASLHRCSNYLLALSPLQWLQARCCTVLEVETLTDVTIYSHFVLIYLYLIPYCGWVVCLVDSPRHCFSLAHFTQVLVMEQANISSLVLCTVFL